MSVRLAFPIDYPHYSARRETRRNMAWAWTYTGRQRGRQISRDPRLGACWRMGSTVRNLTWLRGVYPRPSAIYAANPEAVSLDETSQRPFQTVIPLSERLGLTPLTTYSAGQEAKLVAEILHSSGILLIVGNTERSPRKSHQVLPANRRSKTCLRNGMKLDTMLSCASIECLLMLPGRFASFAHA